MDGLSSSEAKKNQLKFGKNEISKEKKERGRKFAPCGFWVLPNTRNNATKVN